MVGVGAHTVADDFGQDLCSTRLRELQLLEDQDSRAFADDKAVAVLVEGPAGLGRLSLRVESARIAANPPTPRGVMAASVAAGDHRIRIAALDHADGVADGVRACCAGCRRGRVRPLAS